MNGKGAYTITGMLSLIILILAFIGAITVIKFIIKKLSKIIKSLLFLPTDKSGKKYYNQLSYIEKINNEYYTSSYYLSTHLPMDNVMNDKGKYGEYLIFKKLQVCEKYGAKFLFNCYLPNGNNKTTEADIILLTLNGIFVIESKNYSGWIFGDEKQETWMQTLPAGNKIHKERFFNPIMQNKIHINALKKLIGDALPIYSVIVFSNDCTLQNINASDQMTEIVTFGYLNSIINNLLNKNPNSLTQEDVTSIYNKLYPYTQVPEEVRRKHAKYIQAKKQGYEAPS